MKTEIGQVIDALPGLVWTSTTDGHADFLNRRWLEYTGLIEDEAKGIGWQTALHPDDAPAALQSWRERVAAGVAGEAEARLRRFDGQRVGMNVPGYDNRQLALNLMHWLTRLI